MAPLLSASKPDALHIIWTRPPLVEKVEDAIFRDERTVVVEGATKTGKTTTCMIWLLEQALRLGGENRRFWWIGSVYATAEIAYTRMRFGLPDGSYQSTDRPPRIRLPNGAIIEFRSAENANNLFGEDVYAAVADEASRWKEDSWYALRSTLTATRGAVRIIHNVKGRTNWAYKMARRAESGAPDMHYAVITAYDAVEAGILPLEEIEDARRDLPEQVFNELYLCIPSDDGGNPFGLAAIGDAVVPLSTRPPVAFGIDLAKSIDWTVVIGLDDKRHVCVFERFQKPWPETEQRIAQLVKDKPALVDSTGLGDPVLSHIQKLVPRATGFHFSKTSKQQLMEGLAVAIQQKQVGFPEGPIKDELETFEYQYSRTGVSYSAPEGLHDDCVCALALAVMKAGRRAVGTIRGVGTSDTWAPLRQGNS